MSQPYHHRPDQYEQDQIDSDAAIAARLQAEESRSEAGKVSRQQQNYDGDEAMAARIQAEESRPEGRYQSRPEEYYDRDEELAARLQAEERQAQQSYESDEALAARLQAEENKPHRYHGLPHRYHEQTHPQGSQSEGQNLPQSNQSGHQASSQMEPPQSHENRPSQPESQVDSLRRPQQQPDEEQLSQDNQPTELEDASTGVSMGATMGLPSLGYEFRHHDDPLSVPSSVPSMVQSQGAASGTQDAFQSRPSQPHDSQPSQNYQSEPRPRPHDVPQNALQSRPQEYHDDHQIGPPPGPQSGTPVGLQPGPQAKPHGASQDKPPQLHEGQVPQSHQPEPQGTSQYEGGPPETAHHPYVQKPNALIRKSLLIGINYSGMKSQLQGSHQNVDNMVEFLSYKGYSTAHKYQAILRDDQHTNPEGLFWPTGKNMLAAMHWLISEPNTCNFLYFSGHGGQVKDQDSGEFVNTIVPADYQKNGQIDSEKLHHTLVSELPANSTLFVLFDCSHSGSAIELPFVYRSDDEGNVNIMSNSSAKSPIQLIEEASSLITGGFTIEKALKAKEIFDAANALYQQYKQAAEPQEEHKPEEPKFKEDWKSENRFVTMFSSCRDDQASADTKAEGPSVGAMSWAFLEVMKRDPKPTYASTLRSTRRVLRESHHQQVPQLSVGFKELDLDQPLRL